MQENGIVKIIGLKFDELNGLNIITDVNRSNMDEVADFIHKHDDNDIIWIVVPCSVPVK